METVLGPRYSAHENVNRRWRGVTANRTGFVGEKDSLRRIFSPSLSLRTLWRRRVLSTQQGES